MNHLLLALTITAAEADLPPLADADRFPERQTVQANRQFSSEHLEWLRKCAPLNRREEVYFWRWECAARRSYRAWDLLDDVQICNNPLWRRERLLMLRELIGPEAYARGTMPPPVPVAYFARR